MRRKNSPGCPCCGGSDQCYSNCPYAKVPVTDLTCQVYVNGSLSETKTLIYRRSNTGVDTWTSADGLLYLYCDGDYHKIQLVDTRISPAVTLAGPFEYQANPFHARFQYDSRPIGGGTVTDYVLDGPDWWPDPGEGGCESCFSPCAGFYLDLVDATISDANGTWLYLPSGRLQAIGGSPCINFASDLTFKPPTCGESSGRAVYGYGLACDRPGQIGLRQFFEYWTCGSYPGYLYADVSLCGVAATRWVSNTDYQVPAIVGDTITANFSIGGTGVPAGLSIPSTTATFMTKIWNPIVKHYACCSPCPIPKKDLTLSWTAQNLIQDGSATLSYVAGTDVWSLRQDVNLGGGFTLAKDLTLLECGGSEGPILQIKVNQGVGGWYCPTAVRQSYTCDPLHFEYRVPDSCDIIQVLFKRLYVDE